MRERDDRQAIAHQGVVGVVPLRPLCVQPQAPGGYQATRLGQHDSGQLFCQRGQYRCAFCITHQQAVAAKLLGARLGAQVCGLIERHRGLGVGHLLRVGLEAVGHIRKAEQRAVPQPAQQHGVVRLRSFHQFQQVDYLVIPPVADIAPGVVGLDGLPINACAADAVGVVAVRRHGAQEGGHHSARVGGLGRQ